jgi:phosphatidylserine/phosphatidylglycerophosphate/cardiolipin synthase-like enzyme
MNWLLRLWVTNNTPDKTRFILHDETTFYNGFTRDLLDAKEEVIIESPFITAKRLNILKPLFERLINRNVRVYVITRHPNEHRDDMVEQAKDAIAYFISLGVKVVLCEDGHHRKLAIIDKRITWEGSLNILSQCRSREFMRRIERRRLSEELFKFSKTYESL